MIASLRLDDNKAQELLSVRFLPLISCKDVDMVRLLSHQAHVLEAGPFDLHLNRGGTLAQGNYVSIIPHATKVINPYLKNYVKCLRNVNNLQTSSLPVGNPRFFSLIESSSPIFLGVSIRQDRPSEVHPEERGARSSSSL